MRTDALFCLLLAATCLTPSARAADCNENGIDDTIDIADGTSQDCNLNGRPDECDLQRGDDPVGTIEVTELLGPDGFAAAGLEDSDQLGYSGAIVGDINGDGFDDLALGAPNADFGGVQTGAVYVVFGTADEPASLDLANLDGTNGFVVGGGLNNDWVGSSVAAAGDVNDDGMDDLLIGAWRANGFAGATYVLFGSPSIGSSGSFDLATLSAGQGVAISGINAGDRSGWATAALGDVNDDGVDDVGIGAPWASPGGRTQAGEAYVVFGSSTLASSAALSLSDLDGTNGFRLEGRDAGDCEDSIEIAGGADLTGDGIDDFAVGTPEADVGSNVDSGICYVISGGSTLGSAGVLSLDSTNAFEIRGMLRDRAGDSLAFGDFNGDDQPDLAIGAPQTEDLTEAYRGAVFCLYGGAAFGTVNPLHLQALGPYGFRLGSAPVSGGRFGTDVSILDVTDDGVGDIVSGTPVNSNGRAYIKYGFAEIGTSGPESFSDPKEHHVINGRDSNDRNAQIVSTGDFNGDGIGDVLTCAPLAEAGGFSRGEIYLTYGFRILSGGSSFDCDRNGVPDECQIAENPDLDQDLDGALDDCGLATFFPAARRDYARSGRTTVLGPQEANVVYGPTNLTSTSWTPGAPVVGQDGMLWLSTSVDRLILWDPFLQTTSRVFQGLLPAVSPTGDIYAVTGHLGTATDAVFALTPSGDEIWRTELGEDVTRYTELAVDAAGTLYGALQVITNQTPIRYGNMRYAVAADGTLLWKIAEPDEGVAIQDVPMTIDGSGRVFQIATTLATGTRLRRLDPSTGDILWENAGAQVIDPAAAPMILDNGNVLAYTLAGASREVTSFDPESGAVLWTTSTGTTGWAASSPALLSTGEILVLRNGRMYRLDPQTGTILGNLSYPGGNGFQEQPIIGADDTVYVLGTGGDLFAIDPFTGGTKFVADVMNLCPTWYHPALLADGSIFLIWTQHQQTCEESSFTKIAILAGPETTSVDDLPTAHDATSTLLRLSAPYPNPVSDQLTIWLTSMRDAAVTVDVYDVRGRRIRSVLSDELSAGSHSLTWDLRSDDGGIAASGVYFVRATMGADAATRRFVVTR